MNSTSLLERWQNHNYTNYLKIIDGLLYVKDGVGDFCMEVISRFQSEMLTRHKIEKKICTNGNCKAAKIKQGKLNPECPNICSLLLKDILNEHSNKKNPGGIYWENSQVNKWPSVAWEIAKVFMGRGQKHQNNGPQNSDPAGIFQLLKQCNQFRKFVSVKEVTELSERRNKMMHCSELSVDNAQTTDSLNIMIKFLKDLIPKLEANNIDKQASENAVKTLNELLCTDFEIFLKNNKKSSEDEEIKILKEVLNDHESRLAGIEDITEKLEEVRTVIPFLSLLNNNPDLMKNFEIGFNNLHSLSQLAERTTTLEATQQVTSSRLSDVESDVSELQKMLDSLTTADKSCSQVINFKGKLKNFLDSKKFPGIPKYSAWPDPESNDGWMASVTLNLKSDTKTFNCSASCKRIVDAEHSAASEAFNFLNEQSEPLFVNEDVSLATGEKPLVKLEEKLLSQGFRKPDYSDFEEKFDGTVKQFAVNIKVCVNGIIQKKVSVSFTKQTELELEAAKEAVAMFCENGEGPVNAKEVLYRWCGKKHSIPLYSRFPSNGPIKYIHIVSGAFTKSCSIEMMSEWCKSKKEAKQNAADLLLKMFCEIGLTSIWSTRKQEKHNDQPADLSINNQHIQDSKDAELQKLDISKNETVSNQPVLEDFNASPLPCYEQLNDLYQQLQLDPPQFKIINTESHFEVNVSIYYDFESSKSCKSKIDAESEAAKNALAVLLPLNNMSEENKPAKSVLNELFQKKRLLRQPEYLTDGSAGNFFSKVKIYFIASFVVSLQTELEAKEYSAKKILELLGNSNSSSNSSCKNHYSALQEKCVSLKVKHFKQNAEKQCCAILEMVFEFAPKTSYSSKKEAEKNAACFALKVAYPNIDHSDLNKCKNLLQEQTPKVPVKYECIKTENGQFVAKVGASFDYEGDDWHINEKDANDAVAEKFINSLLNNE